MDYSTVTYVERAGQPAPDSVTRAVEANVFAGVKTTEKCGKLLRFETELYPVLQ